MPGKVFQNDVGMYTYSPGLSSVGSYQVSGIPFVTGGLEATSTSAVTINFPYVTNWFSITFDDTHDLRVGFSANGVGGSNYLLLHGGNDKTVPSPVYHIKCSSLYLRGNTDTVSNISVIAGLTSIQTTELVNSGPSGNNWSGSVGVG
jgi:hypothetical protein